MNFQHAILSIINLMFRCAGIYIDFIFSLFLGDATWLVRACIIYAVICASLGHNHPTDVL